MSNAFLSCTFFDYSNAFIFILPFLEYIDKINNLFEFKDRVMGFSVTTGYQRASIFNL